MVGEWLDELDNGGARDFPWLQRRGMPSMTKAQIIAIYALIFIAISLPFTLLHLLAKPDASLTVAQHVAAAVANFFGPWGVLLVRLVDFPNAGIRSFSLTLAVLLTLAGTLITAVPLLFSKRSGQYLSMVAWTLFAIVWFFVGLIQIADGLL